MAPRTALPKPSHSRWHRVRHLPLLIALAAAFNEAGINSAAAAAALTLAVPVGATMFIYEVSVLRDAQLQREALDRTRRDVAASGSRAQPSEPSTTASIPPPSDVAGKLDSMLASRSALLDTFGDDSSTVAPVYKRIIKDMLRDDDATFAMLEAKRERGGPATAPAQEARLRAVHRRLARLAEP